VNRSPTTRRRPKALAFALRAAMPALALSPAAFAYDQHFDYTSFETGFQQSHFDILNYPSINGNLMMTSTDNHRAEMNANHNELAQFYNSFLADYNSQYPNLDAVAEADKINQYSITNSTKLGGSKPQWLILNEISSSVWQDTTQKGIDYRNWLVDCVTRLHDVHGFSVVTFAPFATVGTARAADWQRVAAKSYIGIENYLSGAEVMNGGSDYASRLAWAQSQYQASKSTYMAAGVTFDRLFLGEHFGNTVSGIGYGRSGIASSDWDTVLQIRQDAIRNIGFPGFLAYNWGGNTMGITTAEQLQHEYWYRTRLVLPGQQPQWLADNTYTVNGVSIPISWSQELNWIGGIPNANGAVANFYKTNTASRTITLDGSKTVGTLSFNSNFTYTVAAGTGGTLTFNNSGAAAPLTVSGGSAIISSPIQISDPLNVNLVNSSNSLTFSGNITNNGKAITKSGPGTLTISGAQTHNPNSSLNVTAGTVLLNTDAGSASAKNLAVTVTSRITANSTQHLKSLNITSGNFTLPTNGNRYLHTAGLSISGATGKLDLNDNDLIVDYTSSSPFTQIQQWVFDGYSAGPDSTKTGIISTQGQSQAGTTILALFDNALAGFSEWPAGSGNSIAAEAVVGKYTYIGDTNMDGQVSPQDYTAIDSNLGTDVDPSIAWFYGDTNFDGSITAQDYAGVDGALGLGQSNPLATTAVPEPASLALLPAAYLLSKLRRRR
jgi:autotransporter-associated beta strand protein